MIFLNRKEKQEGMRLLAYIDDLQIDKVKEMLNSGVKPTQKRSLFQSLESPLVRSVRMKSLELVNLLLSYGAPTDERGKSGCTALELACFLEQPEIVKQLLEYKADVSFFHKKVYYMDAARYYQNEQIIKLLLAHQADPTLLLQTHYFRMPSNILELLIKNSKNVPEDILIILEHRKAIELNQQSKYLD